MPARPANAAGSGAGDTVLYGSVAQGAASRNPGTTNPWGDGTFGGTDHMNIGSVQYGATQGEGVRHKVGKEGSEAAP